MIPIGTPATALLPGQINPPAPPTMQNVDQAAPAPQANTSGGDTDMNTATPRPFGGASLGDMLAAKGQSLPTVSSPSLQKLNDGLNAAAQQKAASGVPAKPGDWARSLVAGAQSMLGPAAGAVKGIGASLGDAAAVGTVPRGGGALTGITRTLGARNQRLSEEKTNEGIHAETQMRTLQLVRNMYRQDQQDRTASYKQGSDFMDGLKADRNVEEGVSQDELTRRIKADPNYMHDYIIKPIGEEQLFDADGKPLLDKDKHSTYSPLYGIAPIKSNSNEPSVHTITADDSKYLERNGGPKLPEGTVLDLTRWNNAYTKAHANQDVQNAIKKANDDEASEESQRQMTDLMKNDPSLQHYTMQIPGHPITGLQQAAQNGQDHIAAITQQITQLQQSKDPAAPQKITQLQQQAQQFKDENDKIGKALKFGFTEAAKKDEVAWQDKQKEDAETERNHRATEANKAAEVQFKAGEDDRKDARVMGYGEDADGNTIYTNRAAAAKSSSTFEEVKPAAVGADRKIINSLGDVQMNLSHYRAAAANYNQNPAIALTDQTNLHSLLNHAGVFDLKLKGAIDLDVPLISSLTEGLSREEKSEAYDALSQQGKDLYDGYIRTVSSLPVYMKAVTGSARSNKESLDLEIANIPLPTLSAGDTGGIVRRADHWQENITRVSDGLPNNLPGMRSVASRRADVEAEEAKKAGQAKQQGATQQQGAGNQVPDGATPVKNLFGKIIGYKQNGQQVLFGKTSQQPAQQQPTKQNSQPTVKMTSPDGKQTMNVPADQVGHYESLGAKRQNPFKTN